MNIHRAQDHGRECGGRASTKGYCDASKAKGKVMPAAELWVASPVRQCPEDQVMHITETEEETVPGAFLVE